MFIQKMPIDKTSMFVLIINVHLMTIVNNYNKSMELARPKKFARDGWTSSNSNLRRGYCHNEKVYLVNFGLYRNMYLTYVNHCLISYLLSVNHGWWVKSIRISHGGGACQTCISWVSRNSWEYYVGTNGSRSIRKKLRIWHYNAPTRFHGTWRNKCSYILRQ